MIWGRGRYPPVPCASTPPAQAPEGGGVLSAVTCHILPISPSFFQVAQARGCVGLSHVTKGCQHKGGIVCTSNQHFQCTRFIFVAIYYFLNHMICIYQFYITYISNIYNICTIYRMGMMPFDGGYDAIWSQAQPRPTVKTRPEEFCPQAWEPDRPSVLNCS